MKDFLPFSQARKVTRSLGLKSLVEWRQWRKSSARPQNIPANWEEFRGYVDWLGYEDEVAARRERTRVNAYARVVAKRTARSPEQVEQDRAYHREYERAAHKAHPEKNTLRGRRRRARKRGQIVHFTLQEWQTLKRQYHFRCVGCWKTETELKSLGRKLVPDHIIPLGRGGLDCIENIQPLCQGPGGCNNKKHAKTIDYAIS